MKFAIKFVSYVLKPNYARFSTDLYKICLPYFSKYRSAGITCPTRLSYHGSCRTTCLSNRQRMDTDRMNSFRHDGHFTTGTFLHLFYSDRTCLFKAHPSLMLLSNSFVQQRLWCSNANDKDSKIKFKINRTKLKIQETINNLVQEKVLTVPNVLTTSRMVMAPVLGYLVLQDSYSIACGVFIVAGITDLLDGWIARSFPSQTSELGSFIDPLADKLLVSTLFVTLTMVDLIPVALMALVVTRDVILAAGGFYVRYISLTPRPTSLKQYFDLTNPSARLQPTMISKMNTAIQLGLVAITLAAPVFNYVDHQALHVYWYVTAASTIISGVGYIFAKDTFKLVKQSRKKRKENDKKT